MTPTALWFEFDLGSLMVVDRGANEKEEGISKCRVRIVTFRPSEKSGECTEWYWIRMSVILEEKSVKQWIKSEWEGISRLIGRKQEEGTGDSSVFAEIRECRNVWKALKWLPTALNSMHCKNKVCLTQNYSKPSFW